MFAKGWLEAIEAVKIANSQSTRLIHLLLIGDGECYDYLKEKELPSYIHLLGRKGDVRNYLLWLIWVYFLLGLKVKVFLWY